MTTYTIKQKQSGTGSIHDLASQHHDRDIQFPRGSRYAVVLAACFTERNRTDGYTTHRTDRAAIRQARKLRDYSLRIIDAKGNWYDTPDGQTLAQVRSALPT